LGENKINDILLVIEAGIGTRYHQLQIFLITLFGTKGVTEYLILSLDHPKSAGAFQTHTY
jgi:hypothetical protein